MNSKQNVIDAQAPTYHASENIVATPAICARYGIEAQSWTFSEVQYVLANYVLHMLDSFLQLYNQ